MHVITPDEHWRIVKPRATIIILTQQKAVRGNVKLHHIEKRNVKIIFDMYVKVSYNFIWKLIFL